MAVIRWVFADGATTWTVPLNPNSMSTPFPTKSRQMLPAAPMAGREIRTLQEPVVPFEWTFGGFIRTAEHYDQLLAWSQLNKAITITDHYERTWSVLITKFTPVDQKPTQRNAWRLSYTMSALMLGRVYP